MVTAWRWRRILAGLLVAATLIGCSSKVAYNYLDWLIDWRLDDYIDWTPDQQRQFDQRLDRLLAWHRRHELPRYQRWLTQLRGDVAEPITVVDLQAQREQLRDFWQDLMREALPEIAAQLALLDDAQVDALLANLAEEREEDRRDLTDTPIDEQVHDRERRLRKQLERWTGRLDDQQQALVSTWAAELVAADADWLDGRANWQRHFAAALAQRDQPEVFRQSLADLFVTPAKLRDPAYQAAIDARTQASLQRLATLHGSLSAQQREHLDRELARWSDLLGELSQQAP